MRSGNGNISKIERNVQPADISFQTEDEGKIGRLSFSIRDEINQRLHDGHPHAEIAKWANDLPDVKKIISEQFKGREISVYNISNWRRLGHPRWLAGREAVERANRAAADAAERAAHRVEQDIELAALEARAKRRY
ncbi:MAG: hypothetical protein ACREFR_12260 [Limisphaerales bacterium]